MRRLLLACAGTIALASPASAQMYPPDVPVCLQVYGRVSYLDCSYATIRQCQQSASGRSAICAENPFFVPQDYSRRKRRR